MMRESLMVDAVVLAGGRAGVLDPDAEFKGLVRVAGEPMVQHVVRALSAATRIATVTVVAPRDPVREMWASGAERVVVSDARFIDNLMAGVAAADTGRPVLVCTGDVPALTPEDIDSFLGEALGTGADFVYAVIPKAAMDAQFPGSRRTYVKLVDGVVTGGNVMLMNPRLVRRNEAIGQSLFDTRKSALDMARILGFTFALRLVTGRLTVARLESKMTDLFGGSARAVLTDRASIGADVDKPIDREVVERLLNTSHWG